MAVSLSPSQSTRTITDSDEGVDMRGLVVSIWFERERPPPPDPRSTAATLTAAQKIRLFETGVYPGYGKFVV